MWSSKRAIAAGDTVIVWMTRDSLEPLVVTSNAVLRNKFGVYPHNSFIGLPYGSKVRSSAPSNSGRGGGQSTGGFLYVLRPTPELWTLALPHRTQILYIADISFVINWLGIGPGKRVVEAGTGSGSFSHSVARTIGREGRLFTFEFHEKRAEKARREFEEHGLCGIVRLEHRNVCKDGFGEGVHEKGGEGVDAVFLDLPAPWEAIPHAKNVLRKDSVARICCFSPCIEQVIRTVTALNDAGFSEITMFETLLRPLEVSTIPKLPSIEDATERLKAAEIKREEKRLRQIRANREAEAREKALKEGTAATKRKQDEDDDEPSAQGVDVEGLEAKRQKTEDDAEVMQQDEDEKPVIPVFSTSQIALPIPTTTSRASSNSNNTHWTNAGPGKLAVSKALPEVRGHTSYLTFACLVPYEYAVRKGREGKEAKEGVKEEGKEKMGVNGSGGSGGEGVAEPVVQVEKSS